MHLFPSSYLRHTFWIRSRLDWFYGPQMHPEVNFVVTNFASRDANTALTPVRFLCARHHIGVKARTRALRSRFGLLALGRPAQALAVSRVG